MATIVPYINFSGKTQEAIEFYKNVFGGEATITLAKDGPNAGSTPADKQDQVFHADYMAGDIHILASDMMSDSFDLGNVFSLAVMCDSAEQLREWYGGLVEGGTAVWEPRDSEWGSVYAQCVDRYGIQWMLNYQKG